MSPHRWEVPWAESLESGGKVVPAVGISEASRTLWWVADQPGALGLGDLRVIFGSRRAFSVFECLQDTSLSRSWRLRRSFLQLEMYTGLFCI